MCQTPIHRWSTVCLPLALLVVAWGSRVEAQDPQPPITPTVDSPTPVTASQDDQDESPTPAVKSTGNGTTLRFSFEGAAWRDVIKNLADASDLALQFEDLPRGSFTYSDARAFTPTEALDRLNLFLQPQGFTLVRSGKLLSVINLADPRSLKQLDSLATMITVDQLDKQLDHDVVKCIFPLGELDAEDAVDELSALNLIITPAVFARTNRLLVTDTAGKLKNVKTILDAFQPDALDNGTVVKNFALKHVDAEDILIVARPHMGLATGEMIGIDVSLSADLKGKNLFVTGVEDKVKLIESLITALDVPQIGDTDINGDMKLVSHSVTGGNIETVYNVLLTLLADKPVRLSMDKDADSIVALAAPDVQQDIAETVAQLQASEADFEVIPLKSIDPYFAISLLEEMLDLPTAFDDPDDIDPDAPKIDADPGNMRLYVRGKKHQIEQIKKIVAGLDSSTATSTGSDETVRIVPIKGKQAERLLVTAGRFWRGRNPVILFPSSVDTKSQSSERVVGEENTPDEFDQLFNKKTATPNVRMLSSNIGSNAAAIRTQITPRGIMLQSEDTTALDQFEAHLRAISGPTESIPSQPVTFYLKYAKPDTAVRMLAELLDGGESAKEGEAGSLVNGYSSSGSSFFMGSLVSTQSGATTLTSGTITVIADTRLNRLIAQGTASDMEMIENYLKIVDKDSSITDIQTYGRSRVIELRHTLATEVAKVIREAYGSRIASGGATTATGKAGAAPAKAPAKPVKQTSAQKKAAEPKKVGQGGAIKNLEPQMTIAVHEPSNSLVVTAPEQLFKEVEQLAMTIDSRSEKSVKIINLPKTGTLESQMIQQIFGDRVRTTGTSRPRVSSTKSKSSSKK